MRVVVMAAGPDWPGGVHKHMVEVDGETLLARAVRLSRRYADDVVIAVRDDNRYEVDGARSVVTETRESASQRDRGRHEDLWADDGPTAILFGDVFYTEPAMTTIMTERVDDWRLFCRFEPSRITGKPWGEYFAFRFTPRVKDAWLAACRRVDSLRAAGAIDRSLPWEVYHAMCGVSDDRLRIHRDYGHATVIDDETDDFDSPEEVSTWRASVSR